MCGIVGTTLPQEVSPELFSQMVECLQRRGPDDRGTWEDEAVRLGHRRLSVLDLSPAGAQPMVSGDGNVIMIYNGECYNHLELREKLPGTSWRSHCDTETLLKLYQHFGRGFIRHVVGMFAIAIYDKRDEKIHLYRDRLGEKPLHYYAKDGVFAFASDLKPLRLHPRVPTAINREALRDYFLFNYIPAPETIFQDVKKLPPGSCLTYDLRSKDYNVASFWSPLRKASTKERSISMPQAREELEHLLFRSARGQMISDVPLGCFLSGGIDSSTVAMAMRKGATGSVRTFTIAFEDPDFDESLFARAVARELHTDHTELVARPEDCLNLIDEMPAMFSEPFADASMLPTALLSRLTREHVTVALSGDAGDELFLGYDRYLWAEKVRRLTQHLPAQLRRFAARAVAALPNYRLQMLANGMRFRNEQDLYAYILTGWNAPFVRELLSPSLPEGLDLWRHPLRKLLTRSPRKSVAERGGFADLQHYLPDDILVKVDRCAMHYSLETRVPLLDHRLVEWAMRLPSRLKIHRGEQKLVLKKLLYHHLPSDLFERPKAGFAVPLRHWFRSELRGRLEEALAPAELRRHGLFDEQCVQQLLKRHHSGRWNYERQLWALLMFQLWYNEVYS